jgi:hypothetical protein
MGEQADDRQAVAGEFADRQLGVLLAGFLVRQGAVGDEHHIDPAEPGEGFAHEAGVAFEEVQVELAGVHSAPRAERSSATWRSLSALRPTR